jgi:serine/threonine protein kinase
VRQLHLCLCALFAVKEDIGHFLGGVCELAGVSAVFVSLRVYICLVVCISSLTMSKKDHHQHAEQQQQCAEVLIKVLIYTDVSRIFIQVIDGKQVVIKVPINLKHVNNEKQALSYLEGLDNFVQYADIPCEMARMLPPRALPLQYYQHGDMFDFAQRLRDSEKLHLPEKFMKFAFRQILRSIKHIHSQGIVHRDLKLDNIFIGDNKYHMVLADFGMASFADPSGFIFGDASRCGTDAYMAPELSSGFSALKFDAFAADMWSCGCMLFMLLSCATAFPFGCGPVTFMHVQPWDQFWANHSKTFRQPISPEAKDLFESLCHPFPDCRLSAAKALSHPWLRKDSVCNESDYIRMMTSLVERTRK